MCKCCITITHPSTHTHARTHTYQVQSVEQLFPCYVLRNIALRGIAHITSVFRAKTLISQEPNHITSVSWLNDCHRITYTHVSCQKPTNLFSGFSLYLPMLLI